MVSLHDGEKKFEDMFIRFDVIHERDRRTLHDSKDRTYASHRAVKILSRLSFVISCHICE